MELDRQENENGDKNTLECVRFKYPNSEEDGNLHKMFIKTQCNDLSAHKPIFYS